MPFAPHEIESKRFVVALRGYQTDEVDAFLRAVAADYRAALEQGSDDSALREKIDQLERTVQSTADLRERAEEHVGDLRRAAIDHMREEREQAEAEIAELRQAAERDAAEIVGAAYREAEAAYAEISRQADELRRLESSLWNRVNVLEHTVLEARQSLAHVAKLEPMPQPFATSTLPSVEELLYRVEASLGTETNVEVATADL